MLLPVACVAVLFGAGRGPAQVLASAGFNDATGLNSNSTANSPYNVGNASVVGQGGGEPGWASAWQGGQLNVANVTTGRAYEGDGALFLQGTSQVFRKLAAPVTGIETITVELMVPSASGAGGVNWYTAENDITNTGARIGSQVQANPNGHWFVLDGIGDGGGTPVDTGLAWTAGVYQLARVDVDMVNRDWDFYVDGIRYNPGHHLGFRGSPAVIDEINFLNGTGAPNGTYVDDITVSSAPEPSALFLLSPVAVLWTYRRLRAGNKRRTRVALPLAVISALFAAAGGRAQTTATWVGSTGNWNDPTHWTTDPFFPDNGNGGQNYVAVINSGTPTFNQDVTVTGFTMTGGSLLSKGFAGPFTMTVTTSLNWTGGTFDMGQTLASNGTAGISSGILNGTLVNSGAVTTQGMTGHGAINNATGASWTSVGATIDGTGTIDNYGNWVAKTPSGTQFGNYSYWAFNNRAGGTVTVVDSSMTFVGSGTHDGSFVMSGSSGLSFSTGSTQVFNPASSVSGTGNVAIGAAATIAGTYTPTGQTWVTGPVTFTSPYGGVGQLRVDSPGSVSFTQPTTLSNFLLTGGTLGGPAPLTLNGPGSTMLFSGGTLGGTSATPIQNLGVVSFGSNAKTLGNNFNNTGGATVNWDNGDVNLGPGVTLTNAAGANFNVSATAALAGSATQSAGVFDNLGTVTRSAGSGTTTVYSTFHNRAGATTNVQAGTLNLANPGIIAGTFNVSAGATLAFSGTETLPGSAVYAGAGTLAVGGGTATLAGPLTFSNVALGGGTLTGPGSIAAGGLTISGGTLATSGGVTASTLTLTGGTLGRDFVVDGTSSNQFGGGTLTVGQGFTMTVPAGTTLQATSGTIAGPGAVVNRGVLTKTGTGTVTVSAPFGNGPGGFVQVQVGTLSVGGGTLDGSLNVSLGTTLTLTAGATVPATANLSGAGQVTVGGPVTVTAGGINSYNGGTTVTAGGNLFVSGAGPALGAGFVTVIGGGVLRLTDPSNLAAGVKVTVGSGGAFGVAADVDPAPILASNSAGVYAVDLPSFTTPLSLATLGNGQMFLGSTGGGTYTAASLGRGSGSAYRLGGGGGTLTLPGSNVLTGASSVTVGGAGLTGTVRILANNNFTAGTTLAAGTLEVGANGALGPGKLTITGGTLQAGGGPVNLANSIVLGGDLTVGGANPLGFTTSVLVTGNRTVTVPGGGLLNIPADVGGDVSGRALTKAGGGTMVLSGANTFSQLIVAAGTVQVVGNFPSLGTNSATVRDGGVLRQAAAANLNSSGGARIAVAAGGVLGLDGDFLASLDPTSAGTLAIDTPTYPFSLNQAALGAGQMFVGSLGAGQLNGVSLVPGVGGVYRLGGGGGTLTIPTANLLNGTNSLVIGSAQTDGAGTVVLAAAQNYTGTTTVAAGSKLVLQGGLTGPGTVSVLAGGTLAGSGSANGFVSMAGTLSPGNSPGSLTLANGVAFTAGSHYLWELSALTTAGPGMGFDQVAVTGGMVTVDPAAALTLSFTGTATGPNTTDPFWQAIETWPIITLSGSATASGPLAFQVDNSAWLAAGIFVTGPNPSGAGVDLTWLPASVPEPGTLALTGLAAISWATVRRRRRAGAVET
jgi:fibronectin-binding autotransporter adhesin